MIIKNWKKYYTSEEARKLSIQQAYDNGKKIHKIAKEIRLKRESEILEKLNKEYSSLSFKNPKVLTYV